MKKLTQWFIAFASLAAPLSATAQEAQSDDNRPLPDWIELFDEFLTWNVLDIPVWRVAAFVALLVVGLAMKNYIVRRLLMPVGTFVERTENTIDDAFLERIHDPLQWLAFLIFGYVATLVLNLPDGMQTTMVLVLQTVGTVFVAWTFYRMIDVLVLGLNQVTQKTESEMDDQLVPLVARVLRVSLIALAIVTIVQQWGYDVTSLIAGLGIGGLALALAAQDTLGNWFGGIMIFTDRPFTMGDWVKSSKFGEGVVEEVGMRSTKIRTFSRTVITVPNKEVASASIENFSEMNKRRIKATLGVAYKTTPAQMREILAGIRTTLEEHPAIEQDTFMVNFTGYGESSLEILIYAFTETTVWAEWMEARQDIYLKIMDVVHEAGSEFAFPSRSIYFENPLELESHGEVSA